nr:immunoglobulin light chain junction region [Macaca mulatta]MOY00931.1 immunoglobulin light chain junction region [Macaca mulatta]MOY01019.1 immunoglobulin light chain junction region [Macaca mulatta]MOY01447.1 immunoglobulin light chain junction region [Macaca mulatta]MOY01792.1 immunoglobulin light chain junction region [Macaca mulatta]
CQQHNNSPPWTF